MQLKSALAIALLISIVSGCYTKKTAIEKFCKQYKADTTIVRHDTIVMDSTRIDSVFSTIIDSVFIQQGKLSIKYIKMRDSILLSGKYDSDTIVRIDTIKVTIPIFIPNCNKTTIERIRDARNFIFLAFVLGGLLGVYMKLR
jgi:hypothetical protein